MFLYYFISNSSLKTHIAPLKVILFLFFVLNVSFSVLHPTSQSHGKQQQQQQQQADVTAAH